MERFARFYLETGVAAQAYLRAGYKANSRNTLDAAASRLTRSVKVKARIRELQGKMVTRNRITVDSLIDELDAARLSAAEMKQPSVEVSAIMSKARLVGLLVDRRETGDPGAFATQSEADVMDLVQRELGADAAAALAVALKRTDVEPEPAPDPLPPSASNEGNTTLN